MTTVLVTGVGAIIGYGILRSMRANDRRLRLIGADIYSDAVGQAWCDEFTQAPLTSSPEYLQWLKAVVEFHQVDLIIPGIEQDLHKLSDSRHIVDQWRCAVVLNSERLVNLSRDKWLMHEELAAIGEPSRIVSYTEGNFETLASRLGLPFLLKPRRGYASKGLVVVSSEIDFGLHSHRLGDHLIAQPIIGSADQEYTVGVFGDGHGKACASIALRRTLAADGSTNKAWVCEPEGLRAVLARLCDHFRPVGPTNLQFRLDSGNWKLLEINPRISSSTSVRAAFGYNEAAMSVDFFLEGKTPSQPAIRGGFTTRFIEDYITYDRNHF